MLFRMKTLEKIKSGEVSLAFRKWKKPTVKEGGTLKTVIGLLGIDSIQQISIDDISSQDLTKAGYDNRAELDKELSRHSGGEGEGDLYKIRFHLEGPDPRISLHNDDKLTSEAFTEIDNKLLRLDNSKINPNWTQKVLKTIQTNPAKSAAWISQSLNIEKAWLKPNIRKLKELGLTISLEVGYQISPRGNAYLKMMGRSLK